MPVYKRSTRRALSGCGFYEKDLGQKTNGSTSFHYKIENLKWGASGTDFRSKDQPYKILHINQHTPYKFIIDDHRDFHNVNDDTIKKNYKNKITDDEIKEGLQMHKIIYSMFVRYWNNYVKGSTIRGTRPSKSVEEYAIKLLSPPMYEGGKLKNKHKTRSKLNKRKQGKTRRR
jgi:hypothetical protein